MIIDYDELSRETLPHGGYYITGRFMDADPSGNYNRIHRFYVNSVPPAEAMVTGRVNFFIGHAQLDANPLNKFDLGVGNEQVIIATMVVYVRANPTASLPAIITEIDSEHPNMLWKADKFLSYLHGYLEAEMGRAYNFEEMKQYMIDEQFVGVD